MPCLGRRSPWQLLFLPNPLHQRAGAGGARVEPPSQWAPRWVNGAPFHCRLVLHLYLYVYAQPRTRTRTQPLASITNYQLSIIYYLLSFVYYLLYIITISYYLLLELLANYLLSIISTMHYGLWHSAALHCSWGGESVGPVLN
jgi:hypothetical protein